MKIRALRTLRGDAGVIRRDREADVTSAVAKSLIGRGLAVAVEGPRPKRPRKSNKSNGGAAAPKKGE